MTNCEFSCSIFAVELIYTVIFQQTRCKPAKLNSVVCLEISWNVPVGLCLHILPGAFLYFRDGSWRDLQRGAWKRSVLLANVFKYAGFRNEKLGNRQATKSFEVSSMNAAAATASFSPLFFRGVCDVPALTEASKQASKQAFIYK